MRDIKELNRVLDGDVDEPIVQPKFDGWDQCKVQVQCVFADQVPTKSVERVVLWNLTGVGPIGFIAETLADYFKEELEICPECGTNLDEVGDCEACQEEYRRFGGGLGSDDDDGDDILVNSQHRCRNCRDHNLFDCAENGHVLCDTCLHVDLHSDTEPCLSCEGGRGNFKAEDTCRDCTKECNGCGATSNGDCKACPDDPCKGCEHNDMPPSLSDPEPEPVKLQPATRLAFSFMNNKIGHAAAMIASAQAKYVETYPGCKHYDDEHHYCHQVGDACTFKFCPRLKTEDLDY